MALPDPVALGAILLVIFFAIGIHEYAHAKFADMAGDPTPGIHGRVTLDLTKHFEPVGTIMIILTAIAGFGIGWGRPVPMDPRKMNNPRWDHFIAVLAGPVSNLCQAVLFAMLWRVLVGNPANLPVALVGDGGFLPAFLAYGMIINLSLCVFNLIPLGPLDGMWILGTFLGEKQRFYWTRWNLTVGQFAFLGLVLFSQLSGVNLLGAIMQPPIFFLMRLLI